MSAERPVTQKAWYVWAYDGVEANPSFHAILKFPRIVRIVSVVVVGVYKSVNNPHDHNPTLEASIEDLSDKIVEKKVSTKMDPSVPPNWNKQKRREGHLLQ